jgi:2-phosphoglycerate kinase
LWRRESMVPVQSDETTANAALRETLRHVCWLGGGSGAGKSTIARRIAAQHRLDVYGTDDVMTDHARRTSREDSPFLHRFMAMDMDERWVNRDPGTMVETFPWFRGEAFSLIVEDLLRLPRETGVIVEGFRLLPHLVEPLLSSATRAVWLLPTPDFRQTVFERRGVSSSGFLARTTDPDRALRNLLERDRLFTDILSEEAARLQLPAVTVTATMTEDDLTRRVAEVFGLHSETG